jgi:hypothetical protein
VDNSFGLLGIGDHVSYKMHSTKSTLWVSPDTPTLVASVTVVVFVKIVSCP